MASQGKAGSTQTGLVLQNCVVSRDVEPGTVFSHASGWSFRAADNFQAAYQGNSIAVSQLGNGSKAVVTVDNTPIPSRIEITYLCEEEAPTFRGQMGVTATNQTCEICHVKPAAFCCYCRIPPVFLCHDHFASLHKNKDRLIPNSELRISEVDQDTDKYDVYLRSFSSLKKAEAELRRNVQLMDQFGLDFSVSVDNAIYQLIRYKFSVLGWLQTQKEQLSANAEDVIKESQSCSTEDTLPTSLLAVTFLGSSIRDISIEILLYDPS